MITSRTVPFLAARDVDGPATGSHLPWGGRAATTAAAAGGGADLLHDQYKRTRDHDHTRGQRALACPVSRPDALRPHVIEQATVGARFGGVVLPEQATETAALPNHGGAQASDGTRALTRPAPSRGQSETPVAALPRSPTTRPASACRPIRPARSAPAFDLLTAPRPSPRLALAIVASVKQRVLYGCAHVQGGRAEPAFYASLSMKMGVPRLDLDHRDGASASP